MASFIRFAFILFCVLLQPGWVFAASGNAARIDRILASQQTPRTDPNLTKSDQVFLLSQLENLKLGERRAKVEAYLSTYASLLNYKAAQKKLLKLLSSSSVTLQASALRILASAPWKSVTDLGKVTTSDLIFAKVNIMDQSLWQTLAILQTKFYARDDLARALSLPFQKEPIFRRLSVELLRNAPHGNAKLNKEQLSQLIDSLEIYGWSNEAAEIILSYPLSAVQMKGLLEIAFEAGVWLKSMSITSGHVPTTLNNYVTQLNPNDLRAAVDIELDAEAAFKRMPPKSRFSELDPVAPPIKNNRKFRACYGQLKQYFVGSVDMQ